MVISRPPCWAPSGGRDAADLADQRPRVPELPGSVHEVLELRGNVAVAGGGPEDHGVGRGEVLGIEDRDVRERLAGVLGMHLLQDLVEKEFLDLEQGNLRPGDGPGTSRDGLGQVVDMAVGAVENPGG